MPDARELPRVRRAVVPLMGAGHPFVGERLVRRLPGPAAVVRALNQLAEPAAGLRRIEAIRIGRRSLQVVDLPAGEVRAADVPLLALAVRREDERALASFRPARCTPLIRRSSRSSRASNDAWRLCARLELWSIKRVSAMSTKRRPLPIRAPHAGNDTSALVMQQLVLARQRAPQRDCQPRPPRARGIYTAPGPECRPAPPR